MCWKSKTTSDENLVYVTTAGGKGSVTFVTRIKPTPSAETFLKHSYDKIHEKQLEGRREKGSTKSKSILKNSFEHNEIGPTQKIKTNSKLGIRTQRRSSIELRDVHKAPHTRPENEANQNTREDTLTTPDNNSKNNQKPKHEDVKANCSNRALQASPSNLVKNYKNTLKKEVIQAKTSSSKNLNAVARERDALKKKGKGKAKTKDKSKKPQKATGNKSKKNSEPESSRKESLQKKTNFSELSIASANRSDEDTARFKKMRYVNDSRLLSPAFPIEKLEEWGTSNGKHKAGWKETLQFWKSKDDDDDEDD